MKKALLICLLITGSAFFASAQFQPAGVINIGNGNGGGVQINTNTGQVGVAGTIGGIRVNGTTGGLFGNGGNGNGTQFGNGLGFQNQGGILGLISLAQMVVARSVPLLIGLALLAFFWFLIEFIWKGKDSPEEQKKSKAGMFWSIIALFVMVSVWGIITFMGSVLGVRQGGTIGGFVLPGER